jgi:hypothetical protein
VTERLIHDQMSIKDIAAKRGMTEQTIISHLEKLVEEDIFFLEEMQYLRKTIPPRHFQVISEVILMKHQELKDWKLAPVKDFLDKNKKTFKLSPLPGYREIQLVKLFVKGEYGK